MKPSLTFLFVILINSAIAQTSIDELSASADRAYRSKNYPEAIQLFSKVIAADQSNIAALFWRARAKVELKDWAGAKRDFEIALHQQPNHFGVLLNLSNVCAMIKEYPLALTYIERAEKLYPADTVIYINKSRILYHLKKFDQAIPLLSKVISMDSVNKELIRTRSDCYNFTGQMDLAKKDLERILEIDSNDVPAKINMAFFHVTAKAYTKANALYESLYTTSPDDPYVLSNYGYVKHMLGNSAEGLALINRSLKIFPSNAYAYKYLAAIYLYQNDTNNACKAITTGLTLGFTKSYGTELETLKKQHCH